MESYVLNLNKTCSLKFLVLLIVTFVTSVIKLCKGGIFYTYILNQQTYIYTYLQLRINIIHQLLRINIIHRRVSVTPVTIKRLSYSKNTINIQIFFKKAQ